jgi:hypothetical protein
MNGITRLALLSSAAVVFALLPAVATAQWRNPPQTGSPQEQLPDHTVDARQSGIGPNLSAVLVDADGNARRKRAVVRVQTDAVMLTNPVSVQGVPANGQAHLQYRLDQNPVVNTTQTEMMFDQLSPGDHTIEVALAGNDDNPIGEHKTLKVHIPK